MPTTLYELTSSWLELYDMMDNPELDEDAVLDTIEAIDEEIEIKADGYAKIIAQLNCDVEGLKTEIDRLTARKKTIENNIDRLKYNLKLSMEQTGKTKFSTDLFSFNIVKNGGKKPIELDVSVDELPNDLVVVTEKPDMDAIAAFIEANPKTSIAHFKERGTHLTIR